MGVAMVRVFNKHSESDHCFHDDLASFCTTLETRLLKGVYQASLEVPSTGNTDVVGTLFYDDIEYKSAYPVHHSSPVIVHYPP